MRSSQLPASSFQVPDAFHAGWATPFEVTFHTTGPITTEQRLRALKRFQLAVARQPGVEAVLGPASLLDRTAVQALCTELIPRARVITPNVPEAEALSGLRIASMDDAREAARRLHHMGAAAVIITGGHGGQATIGGQDLPAEVVDLVFDGHAFHECRAPRIDSRHTHGTGCTFASAVAASLALGCELLEAARLAQRYVAGAIAHAPGIGHGRGPLDHFWEQHTRSG